MGSEIKNKRSGTSWFLGVMLIALGGAFLVNQIFPGFVSGLLWAAAFAIGGVAIYSWYMQNRSQWWALIPAYTAEVVAGIILLSTLRFFPGEFIAAFIMFAIGFPFLYVYLRDRSQWWALIPAYTMGAVGGVILLGRWLSGEFVAAYINFAIAAPFLYVYLRNRQNWWALIPGGIMAAIGLAFFVAGVAWLIPVAMILVGVYLLARQMQGKNGTTVSKPPAQPQQTPQYGPEADKPIAEFEPLGARGSGPEYDR